MDPYDAAAVNGLDLGRRKIDDALLAQIFAELSKTAAQFDRSGAFPHENIALLRRHGIIGLQSARDPPDRSAQGLARRQTRRVHRRRRP